MARPFLTLLSAAALASLRTLYHLEAAGTSWLRRTARCNAQQALLHRSALQGSAEAVGLRREPPTVGRTSPQAPARDAAARAILIEAIASLEALAGLLGSLFGTRPDPAWSPDGG